MERGNYLANWTRRWDPVRTPKMTALVSAIRRKAMATILSWDLPVDMRDLHQYRSHPVKLWSLFMERPSR